MAAEDRLATLHYLLGNYDAQVAIDRVLGEREPGRSLPLRRLAYGLLMLGQHEEAMAGVARLDRASSADPKAQQAAQLVRSVATRSRRGDPEHAIRSLVSSVRLFTRAELQRELAPLH